MRDGLLPNSAAVLTAMPDRTAQGMCLELSRLTAADLAQTALKTGNMKLE